MAQRIVAGIVLIGLGIGLFGSQLGGATDRLALGLAMLALWGGIGLAVLAGVRPAQLVGSVLASLGIVLGGLVAMRANDGQATLAADLSFTVDGPTFSLIDVFFGAAAFVVLSIVALVALVLGGRRTAPAATE